MHNRGSRNIPLMLEKGQELGFSVRLQGSRSLRCPLSWATSFVDRSAALSPPQRLSDIYTICRERKEGKKGER